MIQEVTDKNILINYLDSLSEFEDALEVATYLLEGEKSYVYGFWMDNNLIGLFGGDAYENYVSIDLLFGIAKEKFEEVILFLKSKYAGSTLEYLLYNNEETTKSILNKLHANIEISHHAMEWNPFHKTTSISLNSISICKYNEKYAKLFKKLTTDKKLDLEMVYVAVKAKKPIGYIEASIVEDEIYIEELKALPKYISKGVKELLVKEIIKQFQEYQIVVLVSHYEEEEINFYRSIGFEINDDRTMLIATINL
ncbi:MAG: GNAT family N-acetyltransferase [Anaeroplasmataceae bacterium]|nr:GNAT family N-acetyltransferase [Anaeroplasmataceae bacterium]MDE6414212.1 GNAT family N-acetyltransferase [Anaeroplasmataceae bacterium]